MRWLYHSMSEEELRITAKKAIENFELWARRLIDIHLVLNYGTNWYDFIEKGNPIIKKELSLHIKEMLNHDPSRCPRAVDTLFIDDIITLLCRDDLYKKFFQFALKNAYPQGRDEAREFLSRLIPIRNKLNHANHISVREAEKAICYANDFIDSLKEYYKKEGNEKMYNVPLIVRIADSLGNEFSDTQILRNATGRGHCSPKENQAIITVGETFSIEANIDPSFMPSTYSIEWLFDNTWHEGRKLTIVLDESNVRIDFTLYCKVVSNEHTWHRCGDVDDCVAITYKVVPPIH